MMMAACTSDEFTQQPSQPEADGSKGIPFTATISSKAATRVITEKDDGTLETSWEKGDKIALMHNGVVDEMTVSAVDATTKVATITGTITGSPTDGDAAILIYPASVVDTSGDSPEVKTDEQLLGLQDGTLATIEKKFDKRICDGAKLKVSDGNATIDGTATLKNELAIVKFSLTDGTSALDAESFAITDVSGQPMITVEPSSGSASELYVAMAPNTTQAFGFVAKKGDVNYCFSKSGITIEASKYYQQTLALADMLHIPLTLEAAVAGAKVTFKVNDGYPEPKDIEYSTDGVNWTAGNTDGSGVEVTLQNVGDKVMFRGDNSYYSKKEGDTPPTYNTISCTADCYVYGNIMSLINKTGFATLKKLTDTYTFNCLFYQNAHLKSSAYTLELPATTLKDYCYRNMFSGCTSLVTPPALPAEELQKGCYSGMFSSCSALAIAPKLDATTLAENCYTIMFDNCTSLETTPKLAATELKTGCYNSMFRDCTSLKEAWVKADYKAGECQYMFTGCTNASTSKFHTGDTKDHWTTAFANLSDWQFSAYE